MNWLAAAIWWLCCAGGLAGAGYALACAAAAARFRNGTAPRAVSLPTVTILKPLHRAEPQLRENLESFCKQDYGAPIQLILGMNNGDDGAREVADQVKASHPGLDIVVVAGAVKLGTNPKVSNLLNMLPAARHDVLVISDSDIGVDKQLARGHHGCTAGAWHWCRDMLLHWYRGGAGPVAKAVRHGHQSAFSAQYIVCTGT